MNTRRQMCILFIFSLFAFTGCVAPKSMTYEFDTSTNLAGTLRITAHGCHSDASDPEMAKQEMQDFLETELPKSADEITKLFRLEHEKLSATKPDETSTDITLQGNFKHLIEALTPFLDDGSYAISHIDDTFTLTIYPSSKKDNDQLFFKFRYDGPILEENATAKEDDGKVLVWNMNQLPTEGLKLKLKTGK